jgi:type IV pilus assembly protein PilM
MSVVGLDIGSSSIKVARVAKSATGFRLAALGKTATPRPGLSSESPRDQEAVSEAVKKLLTDVGISDQKDIVVALPESKIVSRVIKLPLMSEKELVSSLQYEADAFIPFPLKEAVLRHQIINRNEKEKVLEVLLVAAPKTLVEKYTRLLAMAKVVPLALETELIALNRALVAPDQPNTMIVDFGFRSCNFAISCGGQIYLTRSFPVAGEALTRALSEELGIDVSQAEEYKKAYGLSSQVLEGKVRQSIIELIKSVTGEMRKAIQYFEQEKKETVELITLGGGSAALPNVIQDITASLKIEVQLANPFSLLEYDKTVFAQFEEDGPAFSVAIGLAKREE